MPPQRPVDPVLEDGNDTDIVIPWVVTTLFSGRDMAYSSTLKV
jgi:hypothetical protein